VSLDLHAQDTIAAVATAVGPGAVAIVRASGPTAEALRERVFEPRHAGAWEQARLRLGDVRDPDDGAPLDEALAAWFEAGRSYTGEPLLELQVHGGAVNARRVLDAVLRAGARLAEPGEFSYRAVRAGRLDLSQAEAVQQIVAARSEAAWLLGQRALRGAAGQSLRPLRERVVQLLAEVEASLDFVDDELELDPAAWGRELAALCSELRALLQTHDGARALLEQPRVVLRGPPNAGKSTLLNALARCDRAIVHPTPGTTRDVLEHACTVDGRELVLVDTAGLREAADAIEVEAMARAQRAAEGADLRLLIVDASAPPDAGCRQLLDALGPRDLLVLNKNDLGVDRAWGGLGGAGCAVSARSGQGLDALRQQIAERTAAPVELLARGWVVTTERHARLLGQGVDGLQQALHGVQAGAAGELVAQALRGALDALDAIVGGDRVDDTLQAIFSRFCVGK
jgi:tRNA modification GTPase